MHFEFIFSLKIFSGNLSELENLRSSSYEGVYLATTTAIYHYNMNNFRKGYILMTEDKVRKLPYVIFFPKHSCLEHTISVEINQYLANGLISIWTENLTHGKLIKKFIRSEQILMQTPKIISLNQMRGFFIICLIMYSMSIVIFILEILTLKYAFIRTVLDVCTLKTGKK